MLIDFTEGAVTAIPHEAPRSLVVRIADHPDYGGFIGAGDGSTVMPLQPVEDESFEPFQVFELIVARRHLTGTETTFWIYSAQTDGTHLTRGGYSLTVQHEGSNGWWLEVQQDTTEWAHQSHFSLLGPTFRLPLPDFDPDFTGAAAEVVEREPDWAKLASDDS